MCENTGRKLKIAANHLARSFDNFSKQFGITGTQMSIIDYVGRHPNRTIFQRDIELEFNIQRSTTSVLLKRMEKKGLISRKSSLSDARQKSIKLTKKTDAIFHEISMYMEEQEKLIEQTFSKEELNSFYKVLDFFIQ